MPISGLSPRVRGNRQRVVVCCVYAGSIPACAGEPACILRRSFSDKVYPRVCGGTVTIELSAQLAAGLSPRVRGNHRETCGVVSGAGSIPACAGEPPSAAAPDPASRVYPRVCGGTDTKAEDHLYDAGLSPRVRGNQLWNMV